MSSNALFKFRRNTNSINAPTEEDDSASRDRASSSFRDRFSSATFFASFNKSKPSDNTDALSTQSSSFSFSFLNTNTNTTKDASPKRDYDSDADLYNEGSRSRAGSSFQDDNVQLDFPKIRLPNAPAMHQDDELDVPDIPITSDLDLYADHDTYGSDLDDDLDSSNAKDPRDTGIYYDKILRFLLLSMKLPPSDVASTLEHVQGLRKNTTSLLDENQTEFLHQVQNEVQNLFDHQVRCRAMSVFQRWGLRKVERKRYHMLKYSGVIGRQHAIIELVKAERQYASCLTNGYKAFYIPLSNLAATQGSSRDANFPDSQDFKAIFGNYEEIFQYHSEFLLVLEKSMENWPYAASNIGAILKKSVHALKIYEEYANNFQHSCDTLARFFENAKFTTFIQGSESKHNSDMPLQVCLSQPLDRTSHYERFIEMLLERTPKHHTDYADLSQAYDAMRRLTFSIQSKLEKSGTRAQVLDILRRMQDGHDQFSLESIFIREGELIACHESKLNHRHVFLFDDRIILVRSSTKTMYRFRNMYKISQIKIRDIPDQGNLKHVFEVILPTESFYLSAQSPEEKRSWIEELASVISERIANTVFGVPLENLLKKEGSQNVVPKFIHDAVENILSDGLEVEGIFRIPGNASAVEKLKEKLDSGRDYDFSDVEPSDVAAIIKMWLRDLPEPLIPFKMYDDILEAQASNLAIEDPSIKLCEFKNVILKLPNPNQKALQYLCSFLTKVSQFHAQNKMNLKNLATVFGPNIIRPKVDTLLTSSQIPQTNEALMFIIEKYRILF